MMIDENLSTYLIYPFNFSISSGKKSDIEVFVDPKKQEKFRNNGQLQSLIRSTFDPFNPPIKLVDNYVL